jgi:hypothetical protein
MGALTIAVVTRPFSFEGSRRQGMAETGVAALRDQADTIIVIQNDRLLAVLDRGVSMVDAFRVCDDLLRQGVQGITDMITLPGLINLDFADVRTVIRGAGAALLGIGYASGANRAEEASLAAISSPLLETPIDGARGILLGITGGPDMSLSEINRAARVVAEPASPAIGRSRPARPRPRRRRSPSRRHSPPSPPHPRRRRRQASSRSTPRTPRPRRPASGETGSSDAERAGRGRRGGPPRERSGWGRDPGRRRQRSRCGLRRGVRGRGRREPADRARRGRLPAGP